MADITYIPTGEGWLYLAVILDLFTRKVVGWAMRDHMRAELTMAALTMAIQRRRPGPDLLHHSAVSTPPAITARSWAAAITQSMSRKANCWDGSVGGLWLAVVAAAIYMGSTTAVVPGGADAARFRLALALSRLDGSRDLVVQPAEGQVPPLVLRVLEGRVSDGDREELERLRDGLDRYCDKPSDLTATALATTITTWHGTDRVGAITAPARTVLSFWATSDAEERSHSSARRPVVGQN